MNQTFSNIVVAACKALFATANTAPAIARLLNAPGESESEIRLALKFLFAANAYSSTPQASESSIETRLRSLVGLVGTGGESIKVTFGAGPNVYSVS
jgi:hypothetical protein